MPLSHSIPGQAIDALRKWLVWLKANKSTTPRDALDALAEALAATKNYMESLSSTASRSTKTEDLLSEAWLTVAEKCFPFNHELSFLCRVKGRGWAHKTVWDHPDVRKLPIALEDMVDHLIKAEFAMRPTDAESASGTEIEAGQDLQTSEILSRISEDTSGKIVEQAVRRRLGIAYGGPRHR